MFYPIRHEYVGPDVASGWHHGHALALMGNQITIHTSPGRTNQSHEERSEGWLGTTNDWYEAAYGEYATLAAALSEIAQWAEERKLDVVKADDEDPRDHGEDCVYVAYLWPAAINQVWDAAEWLQECKADLKAKLSAGTDAGTLADDCDREARFEGLLLLGTMHYLQRIQADSD